MNPVGDILSVDGKLALVKGAGQGVRWHTPCVVRRIGVVNDFFGAVDILRREL